MLNFTAILSDLRAAIAVRAARDRTLTVLLVAVWGRIGRMGTRLERLIARWRAGTLPQPGARRAGRVYAPCGKPRLKFPTGSGWLLRKLGYEVAAYGSRLQHLLTDAECTAFLAACPQAGRILRPLLRMLTVDPLPEVVRKVKPAAPEAGAGPGAEMLGVVVCPASHFLSG